MGAHTGHPGDTASNSVRRAEARPQNSQLQDSSGHLFSWTAPSSCSIVSISQTRPEKWLWNLIGAGEVWETRAFGAPTAPPSRTEERDADDC